MGAEKAIIRNDGLYLPITDDINIQAIKNDLTHYFGRKKVVLWSTKKGYLRVPRFYIKPKEYEDYGLEFVDERTRNENPVNLSSKLTLRADQVPVWEKLKDSRGGFLLLGTGKGKTVLALHKIAHDKQRALIFVNNSYLFYQWKRFIKEFLLLDGREIVDEDIGELRSGVFDYKKPIVIAMVQTVLSKIKREELPEDFSSCFSKVFGDEGHHWPASEFLKTMQICTGDIFVLTATEKRTDGKERLTEYYVGDVIYKDISTNLKATYTFIETPFVKQFDTGLHNEKLISELVANKEFNDYRVEWIKKLSPGRKCLCVSSRGAQLKYMHSKFKGSALITGPESLPEERESLIRAANISFIIDQLGTEGLDVAELDTVFLLLPTSADVKQEVVGTKILGINFKQIVGRILRFYEGKKSPAVYIFDDPKIESIKTANNKIKQYLDINKEKYNVRSN
jgi:superfamily II DNA or RNA helicase